MKTRKVVPTDVVRATKRIGKLVQARQWLQGLALARELSKSGLQLDVVCCGALMGAIAGQPSALTVWTESVELVRGMHEQNVVADTRTCNNLVRVFKLGNVWSFASTLFSNIFVNLVRADVVTYNSIGSSMASQDSWEHSTSAFASLPQLQMRPDVISYVGSSSALASLRKWRQAVQSLCDSLSWAGLEATAPCLSLLIAVFLDGLQWQQAMQCFQEVFGRVALMSPTVLGSGINALGFKGGTSWCRCIRALQQLPGNSVCPS
eukprot:TRINITY_DN34699_c0_g1_i5.p1 TRINITY_DN34699_c0_g1~~TRINITY_DN34699_c0_g1_i5.p1  ORF type:complete len:263 (-),score=35.34 TRINITY_DN34699_c0_g1_i5:291-1079(-)